MHSNGDGKSAQLLNLDMLRLARQNIMVKDLNLIERMIFSPTY